MTERDREATEPGSAAEAGADTPLLARPELGPGPAEDAELLGPRTVRLRRVKVLGNTPADDAAEEGTLGPGIFLPLLRRLFAARFTGMLEASGEDGVRIRIFFSDGVAAAARSNDSATGFGQVLLGLGILSPAHLEASLEEGRRTGAPLGEVLLRTQRMDRRAVERALREQVLLRAVAVGRMPSGRYLIDPSDPMGIAGFDVHPAAIALRLGDDAPALTAEELDRYVRLEPEVAAAWTLFDPDGQLGMVRALLVGGAAARDCVRVGGPPVAALLALLRSWGLAHFTPEAPPAAVRDAGLAELEVDTLAEHLRAEHLALRDADHYTLLGVRPDADTDDVNVATIATLARFDPDTLPAALDTASRARARAIYERALEAARTLGDPERRSAYDACLTQSRPAHTSIEMEDHAVLQADRARDLFLHGEFVTAAALFHMAIQLEGEAADILAMLGWARHRACPEDPAAGEAELRRALALEPDEETTLTWLGRLLAARGEVEEARRLLRAAIDKNHEFEPARDALRELDG